MEHMERLYRMTRIAANAALIVIDVQKGFDEPAWSGRNNPHAEENIGQLVAEWDRTRRPIVRVRHASKYQESTLYEDHPGHAYKQVVADIKPALEVVKSVHSAFLGKPDLHKWLQAQGVGQVAIAGIATNWCCETTARFAGDLGYDVLFVLDATHTFDQDEVSAIEITRVTKASLHGHFATVLSTADILKAARNDPAPPPGARAATSAKPARRASTS
jgi:nicotinamidase-related amidase